MSMAECFFEHLKFSSAALSNKRKHGTNRVCEFWVLLRSGTFTAHFFFIIFQLGIPLIVSHKTMEMWDSKKLWITFCRRIKPYEKSKMGFYLHGFIFAGIALFKIMEILYYDDETQKRKWTEVLERNLTSRDFKQFIISCLSFKEMINIFFVFVFCFVSLFSVVIFSPFKRFHSWK